MIFHLLHENNSLLHLPQFMTDEGYDNSIRMLHYKQRTENTYKEETRYGKYSGNAG